MRLVFVHGSGCTARVFKYQTERFPNALAVTLPGHGEGEHLGSVAAMARWLHGEIEAGGGGRPLIVGHSLGGAIAQQYALDYPGAAAGLCLIGSGARLRVTPTTLEALEASIDQPAPYYAMMTETWRRAEPHFAGEMEAQATALGPVPFLNDLRACDAFDVIARLEEIDVPVLAIVGSGDVMTPPKYSAFLCDRIPNAKMEVVDGGTHFVFAELPEPVNDAIARFAAELESANP